MLRIYPEKQSSQQNLFIFLLLLASVSPFLFVPFFTGWEAVNIQQIMPLAILWLLSHAHQSSTISIFLDKSAYPVIRNNKRYFFFFPLFVLTGVSIYHLLANQLALELYLIFFTWLTVYHYQKQNIGVYVILASKFHPGKVSEFERHLEFWSFLVGAIGVTVGLTGLFGHHDQLFKNLSLIPLAILLISYMVFLVVSYKKHGAEFFRKSLVMNIILLFMVLFYVPIYFFPPVTAFLMYGGAHALQYFLLMSLISLNVGNEMAGNQSSVWMKFVYVALAFLVFAFVTALADYSWLSMLELEISSSWLGSQKDVAVLLAGIGTCFSIWHYIIDARLWKLSLPDSRKYVMKRLGYGLKQQKP
ncbi:MAG: hypothetical protein KDI30_12850 [Pseudomonadales bacterium]|nr:hypothetical protein [Pseudomonadales bacterium]